jgi:hypothetical protein
MKALVVVAAMLGAAATAQTNASNLATRPGLEVGGQAANYQYLEPDFAKFSGDRVGILGAYTFTGSEGFFSRIDARGSYGALTYTGSGTQNYVPDLILETRAVVGRDVLPASGVSLSPYVGLGYRYLYNDFRGYSTDGTTTFVGYRRYSRYHYAPIGLTARIDIGGGLIFAPTVEVDVFLWGRQKSKLSDTGLGYIDVSNRQNKGRGHRLYLMFERDRWTVGAWTHYWHIEDSDTRFAGVVNGIPRFGSEPENYTRESGLEIRYRF